MTHSACSPAMTMSMSSALMSTSRAFEPSLGPTMPRDSRMSMRRPAFAKPTRSLRCSIDVEPNCVDTTSSTACMTRSRSLPMSPSRSRLLSHGLVRTPRQEQAVTLTDQLFGSRLVEDDSAVGERTGRKREPAWHVGLDQAGHHVDARTLRREHKMDAGGAGELRDAHDRVFDVTGAIIIRSASSSTTTSRYGYGASRRSLPGGTWALPVLTALLKSSIWR